MQQETTTRRSSHACAHRTCINRQSVPMHGRTLAYTLPTPSLGFCAVCMCVACMPIWCSSLGYHKQRLFVSQHWKLVAEGLKAD